jgi:hypothetical protein
VRILHKITKNIIEDLEIAKPTKHGRLVKLSPRVFIEESKRVPFNEVWFINKKGEVKKKFLWQ